jgi:hypothetical protein
MVWDINGLTYIRTSKVIKRIIHAASEGAIWYPEEGLSFSLKLSVFFRGPLPIIALSTPVSCHGQSALRHTPLLPAPPLPMLLSQPPKLHLLASCRPSINVFSVCSSEYTTSDVFPSLAKPTLVSSLLCLKSTVSPTCWHRCPFVC